MGPIDGEPRMATEAEVKSRSRSKYFEFADKIRVIILNGNPAVIKVTGGPDEVIKARTGISLQLTKSFGPKTKIFTRCVPIEGVEGAFDLLFSNRPFDGKSEQSTPKNDVGKVSNSISEDHS